MNLSVITRVFGVAAMVLSVFTYAQDKAELPEQTLFKNVNVFNGVDKQLYKNYFVLVEKNRIKAVSPEPIAANAKAVVVDGSGRTLMPGLIDAHVHLNLQYLNNPAAIDGVSNMTWEEIGAMAYDAAQEFLYSGFTTVRDLCGMHDGMRKHIESGTLIGPRMYLAGACISQTSGHGDWRTNAQVLGDDGNKVGQVQALGITTLADGADEVLKACRNNLAGGADFCKMMAGGGVTSMRDPLHSIQGTMDELKAMVTATSQWDTVGAVHAYHDDSVERALKAGMMSIEHGNLMVKKSTFKLVKKKGAFVVPAMAGFSEQLLKHPQYGNPDLPLRGKVMQIIENYDNWLKLANETNINIGYGTDVVVSSKLASRGIRDFQMGQFSEGFGNYKTLVALTSANGRLMALTGKNNPYPAKLGVIEQGAYADIILVDGNPLEDISVLGASFDMWAAPRASREIKSIPFVMKDGQVFLNKL
ncbi:amidohydrolase family protein [Agaribacterium sp. ZY112]|uniref:metal-dependent hydrolase family protein n=1 Tax=Agaribacterium sp. ZY112 TaxID=3233574 RepID=UPI00352505C5